MKESAVSDLLSEEPCYFNYRLCWENRSTSPQASATRDLMTAGIIGFTRAETSQMGYVKGHSVTLAISISPPTHQHLQWTDFLTLNLITNTLSEERQDYICVTWSWWSKKVLMHALELASQTFTLLSDELRAAEERGHFTFYRSHLRIKLCLVFLTCSVYLGTVSWKLC